MFVRKSEIKNMWGLLGKLKKDLKETEKELRAIKTQLRDPMVEVEEIDTDYPYRYLSLNIKPPMKTVQKMTLRGKVNAIADHLKLDIDVQPAKVVKTPAKLVVKKVTKKKGKK